MTVYIGSNKIKSVYVGSENTNCIYEVPNDINLTLDALNVSLYGSVTNNLGVLSNFSTSNYAKIDKDFNNNQNFEIVVKVTVGATTGDYKAAIAMGDAGFFLGLNSGNKVHVNIGNGSSWGSGLLGSEVLTVGSVYYLKATRNGTTITGYHSSDGVTWVTDGSFTSNYANTNRLTIGVRSDLVQPNTGSIDITQSYIKINNEYWWKGGTGTLTLKAGSKLYVPNGFETDETTPKFDVVTLENDISRSNFSIDGTFMLWVGKNSLSFGWRPPSETGSGDSTSSFSGLYYRTDLNKIFYNNNTSGELGSFPICIFTTANSGVPISIDQVFNWCGCIGSTDFILPGVKCLISDSYKADGTYKNINYTVPNVRIATRTWTWGTTTDKSQFMVVGSDGTFWFYNKLISSDTEPSNPANYTVWHNDTNNKVYYKGGDGTTFIEKPWVYAFWCGSEAGSTKITSITPATVQPSTTAIKIGKIYNGSDKVYSADPYPPGTVLVDISGAASSSVNFLKGKYQIYAQGAGGGGGSNNFWDNGGGGGSGAGFNGYVVFTEDVLNVAVSTGNGGGAGGAGTNTVISGIFNLQGGRGGGAPGAGAGGTYTFTSDSRWYIESSTVARNGNAGGASGGSGGNSVLTNSGGSSGGSGAEGGRGAGGGGGAAWGATGGCRGGIGECKITYVGQ